MRNFDERKEEIFRRSNERIKYKKRLKNRIVMTSTPLLVCVIVFSVAMFSPMMSAKKDCNEAIKENQGLLYSNILVEVKSQNGDYYEQYNDNTVIINMSNAIQTVVGTDLHSDEDVKDGAAPEGCYDVKDENATISSTSKSSYTITFIKQGGSRKVYVLSGNSLIDNNSNQQYLLTDNQLSRIKIAFNISEK